MLSMVASNLSNRGEGLAIEKPQPPDQPGSPSSWVIADEVICADVSPWPKTGDGSGDTLQRIRAEASDSGNYHADWTAAPP